MRIALHSPGQPSSNDLDDVFGDENPDPPSANPSTSGTLHRPQAPTDPSDIPRLRSIHVTAGYRDGIASSKAAYVQEGFDEGFSLGAVLGRRVGYVLGGLEGMVNALKQGGREGEERRVKGVERARRGDGDEAAGDEEGRRKALVDETKRLHADAQKELKTEKVFGREYFNEEGIWHYDVEGAEQDTTFEVVADAHPLLKSWEGRIADLTRRWNIDMSLIERDDDRADGKG